MARRVAAAVRSVPVARRSLARLPTRVCRSFEAVVFVNVWSSFLLRWLAAAVVCFQAGSCWFVVLFFVVLFVWLLFSGAFR